MARLPLTYLHSRREALDGAGPRAHTGGNTGGSMSTRRVYTAAMVVTAAATLAGCEVLAPACTAEARPAIRINVLDSLTSAAVGNGSRVIAREGTYADTAEFLG